MMSCIFQEVAGFDTAAMVEFREAEYRNPPPLNQRNLGQTGVEIINNTANKNNKLVKALEAQMITARTRCVSQR